MEKFLRPSILIALLVVLAAGALVGLAAAHGGDDQVDNDCEMNHVDDDCEMSHGEEDCPMMGSGMMAGMMEMGDDCPMEQNGGMMGMDGGASNSHRGC